MGADSGSFVPRAPNLGQVAAMDGIRGIGVTMLLVGHALFSYLESWVNVVDAFFVLSGFLITTLLIQEHRKTGTISLKGFYWRRGLRLFPSVWLFVAVWLVFGLVVEVLRLVGLDVPEAIPGIGDILADGAAAVGYVYHLFFPNGLYVIEPDVQSQRTMWHLWTLGMEEWFYLGIAGTVLICVRRNWVKQLGIVLGVGVLAIGVARWFAFTGFFQDNPDVVPGVRMIFMQRPDALMLGVVVAILSSHMPETTTTRFRRPLVWLATAGLLLWILMLHLSSGAVDKLGGPYFEYFPEPENFNRAEMMSGPYWFRFGHTLGALGFACVIFGIARYRDWWVSRAWSAKWLQWMGQRSYTIYIWHALPFLVLMALTGGQDASPAVQVLRTPIMAAAAIGLSVVVYNRVEMRVLRSKLAKSKAVSPAKKPVAPSDPALVAHGAEAGGGSAVVAASVLGNGRSDVEHGFAPQSGDRSSTVGEVVDLRDGADAERPPIGPLSE